MGRPRKQTYTLDMYLEYVKEGDISNNADVQRQFVWSKEQINELIVTVLTDDYIPPIILGEEESSQLWVIDGGQRTAALNQYKNGNYKITSMIETSIIPYRAKVKDEKGNNIWKDMTFNIKNTTYNDLPEELKKKFNRYQIETVIHENCDNQKISKYIKRYNNHTDMNTNQKAFTYIDKFAKNIREILAGNFFLDCSNYAEKEKVKGAVERVIVETIMCTNHLDNWKKQIQKACTYLNNNGKQEEFEKLANNIHRLENIIVDDIKDIFNVKDSFIFLTLFDRFTKLEIEDIKFAEFLREFKINLRSVKKNSNGMLFDEIDKNKGTKDKIVIVSKLNMLEMLMKEFLHIEDKKQEKLVDEEVFISENVGVDIEILHNDIDFYKESLNDLEEKSIKIGSKLLDKENQLSLLAMVVYSYKEDKDLDEWLTEYARRNNTYFKDQKKNYLHMVKNFQQYISCETKISA